MAFLEIKQLSLFRWLGVPPVIASMLGAALMLAIGVLKTVRAYFVYFDAQLTAGNLASASNEALALVVQSIDAFLIAMVLVIFAYGITTLFIRKIDIPVGQTFDWIKIKDIGRLKLILGELIIMILFVKFLETVLLGSKTFTFEMFVLPGSILVLAVALKILYLDPKAGG